MTQYQADELEFKLRCIVALVVGPPVIYIIGHFVIKFW